MDSLISYVADWFQQREFLPYFSRGGWRVNAAWLADEERRRPGFTTALRVLALQHLGPGAAQQRIRALRALAVVADEGDIAQIANLTASDAEPLRTEARRALRRIKYRHSPVRFLIPAIIVMVMFSALILAFLTQLNR